MGTQARRGQSEDTALPPSSPGMCQSHADPGLLIQEAKRFLLLEEVFRLHTESQVFCRTKAPHPLSHLQHPKPRGQHSKCRRDIQLSRDMLTLIGNIYLPKRILYCYLGPNLEPESSSLGLKVAPHTGCMSGRTHRRGHHASRTESLHLGWPLQVSFWNHY